MNCQPVISLRFCRLSTASFLFAMMTAATGRAAALQIPDYYALSGPQQVRVAYAPASDSNKAMLKYSDRHRSRDFSAAEIRSSETAVGQLVTVSFIDADGDDTIKTFSFFLPDIDMGNRQAVHFSTPALYTVTRSGLEPTPGPGPHQDYRRQVVLTGTAMRTQDGIFDLPQ